MKKINRILLLLVLYSFVLSACGSDDNASKVRDTGVATEDKADKVSDKDVVEKDAPVKDNVIRAKRVLTVQDYVESKELYQNMVNKGFELPIIDKVISSGIVYDGHRLSVNEFCDLVKNTKEKSEFLKKVNSMEMMPDAVFGETKIYMIYGSPFSLETGENESIRVVYRWNDVETSYVKPLYEGDNDEVIKIILEDRNKKIEGLKGVFERYTKIESIDYSSVEYPYSDGVLEGSVEYYGLLEIEDVLRIKNEEIDIDSFIKEFLLENPAPYASVYAKDEQKRIDLYETFDGTIIALEVINDDSIAIKIYVQGENTGKYTQITYNELGK